MTSVEHTVAYALARFRVGRGYPDDGGGSFVGVVFVDDDGQTLTFALTDEQAAELAHELGRARIPDRYMGGLPPLDEPYPFGADGPLWYDVRRKL